MAGPETMAEATPTEAPPRLAIANASGHITETRTIRPPEPPRPPEDPLAAPRLPERDPRTDRVIFQFDRASLLYDHYSSIDPRELSAGNQARLEQIRERVRGDIERLYNEAENEPSQPLKIIMDKILEFYDRVKKTRNSELTGRDRQQAIDMIRQHGPEQERIFRDYLLYRELQAKYGGLPSYLVDGVAVEMDTEENDRKSPDGSKLRPLNALAELVFPKIKRLREKKRMKETQIYDQEESHWGGQTYFSFGWPESAADMIRTSVAWVKDRIEGIGSRRDVGTAFKLVEEIRGVGVTLLETCRLRINREVKLAVDKIKETNPRFLRARAFAEAIPDVLGNELAMKEGDTESGPKLKKRFASDVIANHNALYLENRKAAYIMHKLTKTRDGTYWTGHGWDVEKAEAGAVIDHRQEIEEEVIEDAATHDLFTEFIFAANKDLFPELIRDELDEEDVKLGFKGFFELREKYHLDYGFDDPLERMLLDPDNQIRDRIAATGDQEALRRHDLRVAVFRRTKGKLDEREGLGFVTNDERRMLERRQHRERPLIDIDNQVLALAEFKRNRRRGELQQQGFSPDQIEVQIRREMEARRQVILGARIRRKMETKINNSFLAEISIEAMADFDSAKAVYDAAMQANDDQRATEALANCNRIAWDWVKAYNNDRVTNYHLNRWYPSGWDKVRIKIDRPTKAIDRTLSEEEFEAMYEKVQLLEETDDEDIKDRIKDIIDGHKEDARFGFQLAKSYQIFLMQDTLLGGMRARLIHPITGEYIGKLVDDNNEDNQKTNKRLGLIEVDDQGRIIYDQRGHTIGKDGNRKLVRIFDVVQARLQIAIEEEEVVINQAKAEKAQTEIERVQAIRSGDQQAMNRAKVALEEKAEKLRDILVNSQFLATHALKAKGLVEGRLPVWSFNYLDRNSMYVFTEALADYGLQVAPGNYMDHNRKKEFYEILERGRRGWKSESNRAIQEFMVGTYPVFERDVDGEIVTDTNGNPVRAISLFTAATDYGDPSEISEKFRISNKGAPPEDTRITDAGYDMSTSGALIAAELIPSMGQLGFDPMLVWFGITSIRELNNYIKGPDEVKAHSHKLFDVKDMPDNADAQAAAYVGRRALTGGKLPEVAFASHTAGITPGFLNEIYLKSTNIAEVLRNWYEESILRLTGIKMGRTEEYVKLMQKWRESGGNLSADDIKKLEEANQLTYLEFDKMSKPMSNKLYFTTYDVMSYFLYYLHALKEVEQNRAPGQATRTWHYNNTLRWYAFRRAQREAGIKEKGMIVRHKFSPEAGSEIALRMQQVVLEDADYLILTYFQRNRLSIEGSEILSRVLTPTERNQGFEVRDERGNVKRTFVIPDEKDWQNLVRPEVRTALENIRRRGLLEFMTEEGYFIFDVDDKGHIKFLDENGRPDRMGKRKPLLKVLGNEMPPLVQQQKVRQRTAGLRLIASS